MKNMGKDGKGGSENLGAESDCLNGMGSRAGFETIPTSTSNCKLKPPSYLCVLTCHSICYRCYKVVTMKYLQIKELY